MGKFFGTDDALNAIIESRAKRERMLVVPISESSAKLLVEYIGWSRGKKKRGKGKESYASSYDNLLSILTNDCQKHIADFAQERDEYMHPTDNAKGQ